MALSSEIITGTAAPFLRDNVDAMMIAPRTPAEKGGAGTQGGVETVRAGDLFAHLRFADDGQTNPDFILNRPQFREAKFLIAGSNFGCGSAREHAVWALRVFGIAAVIAPSFGALFYGNCFKNGLVPIELQHAQVLRLADECAAAAPLSALTLDLASRTLSTPNGHRIEFTLPAFRHRQLLEGLDEIAMTLQQRDRIREFRRDAVNAQPWLSARNIPPTGSIG